jgi:hypothetical protein
MEQYSKVAHEQNGMVIFFTPEHLAPSVYDTIYEIEKRMIRLRFPFDEERREK